MQRLASPFPFGTSSLDWLAEYLKAGKNLLRLGIGRVRDQAVAVDMEAYYAKGKIQAFNATLRFLDEASTRSRRRGMRRGAMAYHRRRYANAQTRKHTHAYVVPVRAWGTLVRFAAFAATALGHAASEGATRLAGPPPRRRAPWHGVVTRY